MKKKHKESSQAPKPQHQATQPGKEFKMDPKPKYEVPNPAHGRLNGKVALITGGDSGIGRSVALAYVKEGASVAVIYLNEKTDAKETEKLLKEAGGNCLFLSEDVKDPEACTRMVQRTLEHFGKLDIVINNAAVQYPQQSLEDIDNQQLKETFDTNIFPHFYVTRAALPYLQSGASIISTTSVTAYRGSPHLIDYASTKGAIVAFIRSLAINLAPKNIRVNGVAPGPIWTPLIPSSFDKEHVGKFGKDVPLGRPGQPNEVAPAYVYLGSDESSYMTGQIMHPNGGEIING